MKAVTLFLPVMLLPACNTVEGLDMDIKQGGDVLEKAATK